jgi:hypothetical protein
MASNRQVALTLPVLIGLAAPALAACPQALAVYGDGKDATGISFAGPPGEADAMLHRFELVFAASAVKMEGVVMLAGEPDRPWGIVMHDCPEGDATGAEIEACTVWQGPVYAIDGKGEVDWLPVSGEAAAGNRLLLPDFGAAVMQSAAYRTNQITRIPGDVFGLKACQE